MVRKIVKRYILRPLLEIFDLSLTMGIIQNDLIKAKVLLTCFSEVLERLVANQFNKFIDKHEILDVFSMEFLQFMLLIWQ